MSTDAEFALLHPSDGSAMATAVFKKRWLILALYFGFGLSNQMQYVAYTTIVEETKQYFDCDSLQVNLLAAVFALVYVFFVFPGCAMYDHVGLKWGMSAGTLLNGIGSVVKLLAAVYYPRYWLIMVAQVFNAFAQVLFLSLPPLVASTWFPQDERTLATAIGTLSGFVGMAVSMFYAPRIVQGHPDKEHFTILFVSQMVIALVVFLGTVSLVDHHPPLPPSITANRKRDDVSSESSAAVVSRCLKKQIRNRNLMVLALCFGIVNGLFTAIASMMSQLLQPFGLSEEQTGIIAFSGIFSGAMACAVVAPFIDKHRIYKKPLMVTFSILIGLTTLTIIGMFVVDGDLVAPAFVMIILIEIVTLPAIPITLEFAVELTFPDPESIASSWCLLSLSLWSVIGSVVYSIILTNNPTKGRSSVLLLITVGAVAASVAAIGFLVKEEKLRQQHEINSVALSEKEGSVPADNKSQNGSKFINN